MTVVSFSEQCKRVRRQLDAYLSNELLVETTSEVLRHLESCEACSRELELRVRVREALQRAVANQLPPESMREAIHQRLVNAQPGFFGGFRPTTWAVALAGLTLLVFAGIIGQQGLKLRRGRQTIASVLALGVSDHAQCAIKGHNYPEVANPPDQLRKKLGPQYAGLLPIVQEKLEGFQVLDAHICSVPGSPRQYIHFIARGQGKILSVILTKREGEALPSGKSLVAGASGGIDLYKAQLEGLSVAGFEVPPYVSMETPDSGYYVGLDLESMLHPQTLLCYGMNGAPLTDEHGAPLRLVIPVKYGVKNIKRIGTIRYSKLRPADYWAEQGYDWYIGL